MLTYEEKYVLNGINLVAGVDEAGRGPLAGPVVCACVIMPMEKDKIIAEINDSKKLSAKKREILFDKIKQIAIDYKIKFVDEKIIDEINILNATKMGMENCIIALNQKPEIVLIDAVKGLNIPYESESIIHGDALSYNIAAASILAKVSRDRYMEEMDKIYPEYNFAKHKGYGTKEHIQNLQKYGKCKIHRKSFIKNFIKE